MGFLPLHRIPDVKSLEWRNIFESGRYKATILVVGAPLRVASNVVDGLEKIDGSIRKLLFGIYFYRAREGCIGYRSDENPNHVGNNQVVLWKAAWGRLLAQAGQYRKCREMKGQSDSAVSHTRPRLGKEISRALAAVQEFSSGLWLRFTP